MLGKEKISIFHADNRIAVENVASCDNSIIRSWADHIVLSPNSSVYQHPAMVMAENKTSKSALYLYDEVADSSDSTKRLMGVIADYAIKLSLLPIGARGRIKIDGLRLVGDTIAGIEDSDAVGRFISATANLLHNQKLPFVIFEEIEEGSLLWKALWNAKKNLRRMTLFSSNALQTSWRIQFPEKAEDYWKAFSSKSRYNLRNSVKKLDHELICYRSPEDVVEMLSQVAAVSTHSWQDRRLGMRIIDTPSSREYWCRLASLGAMRSYVLRHKGEPVAFGLGVQWNGRYRFEQTAYDRRFSSLSPGRVLVFRMLEEMIAANTPREFDFGYGDGEYKRFFGNREGRRQSLVLARTSLKMGAMLRAHRMNQHLVRLARQFANKVGLIRILRRRHRTIPE